MSSYEILENIKKAATEYDADEAAICARKALGKRV